MLKQLLPGILSAPKKREVLSNLAKRERRAQQTKAETPMKFNFRRHQPPMELERIVHQLPIELNFPKVQWCKIPRPLPRIGETSGSTRKMHFILQRRGNKGKIQMVDLFHHNPDVYIRQLQVRMPIAAINSPAACSRSLPLDLGGVDDGDRPKNR